VQVTCIRENDPSCSLIGGGTGVGYRKGLVVGFPCNEQSVDALIVTAAQLPFRFGSQFTPSKSRSGIRTVSRLEGLVTSAGAIRLDGITQMGSHYSHRTDPVAIVICPAGQAYGSTESAPLPRGGSPPLGIGRTFSFGAC
jgi:hypothetical protein